MSTKKGVSLNDAKLIVAQASRRVGKSLAHTALYGKWVPEWQMEFGGIWDIVDGSYEQRQLELANEFEKENISY